MLSRCLAFITILGLTCTIRVGAGPEAVARRRPVTAPDRLDVYPATVKLDGRRAGCQLVVTGYFHGEPRDLTQSADYRAQNDRVARLRGCRVTAAGDGHTTVTVRFGGRSAQVPVFVS